MSEKAPWYIKITARIFLKWFLKDKLKETYQCSGKINWVFPNSLMEEMCKYRKGSCTADIQVPYCQLAHWLANSAGYEFSSYSLLKAWGSEKQVIDLVEEVKDNAP